MPCLALPCLALPCLALPVLSYAEMHTLTPILKHIEQINTFGFPFNRSCGPVCPAPQDENALLHQCAVDICGPPNQSPRFLLNNDYFNNTPEDTEIQALFNKRARPAIVKALQNDVTYKQQILAHFGDKLKDPDSKLNNMEWDQVIDGIYRHFIDNPSISEEEKQILKKFYNDKKKASSIKNNPSFFEDRKSVVQSAYQEFLSTHKDQIIQMSIQDQDKIRELGILIQNTQHSRLFNKIADDLEFLIRKVDANALCSSESCRKIAREYLSDLYDDLSSSLENQNEESDQYLKYCESLFISQMTRTDKVKDFKNNIKNYKQQFTGNFLVNYSAQSRENFKSIMDNNLNWKWPSADRETAEKAFFENLSANITWRDKGTKPVESSIQPIRTIILNRETKGDICSISMIQTGDSIGLTGESKGTMNVSLLSCAFHDHGKQVLAHEFAHLLSHAFNKSQLSDTSYNKYKKLRECVRNRYKDNKFNPKGITEYPDLEHEHDRLRTEEDTADIVSHIVFYTDPTLSKCGLLKSNAKGLKYKDLSVFYQDEVDPHSPSLLRVLMEAIHKRKKLPPSCQQVIDRYKDQINFEPCF